MSDPYGPTFPPPGFMAPREPADPESETLRNRLRHTVVLVAPVATLVLMVGLLAAIMWQGDHGGAAHVKDGRATTATVAPTAGHQPS
ncbi:hypothetical protein ABZ319_18920 [Nocardia sp. NPDC005978]|uniref:hypothetical protein n=1 Tax=Nocardia sp. NPDC005978 TaxID=3156725 RepID=UPI0033BED6D3